MNALKKKEFVEKWRLRLSGTQRFRQDHRFKTYYQFDKKKTTTNKHFYFMHIKIFFMINQYQNTEGVDIS